MFLFLKKDISFFTVTTCNSWRVFYLHAFWVLHSVMQQTLEPTLKRSALLHQRLVTVDTPNVIQADVSSNFHSTLCVYVWLWSGNRNRTLQTDLQTGTSVVSVSITKMFNNSQTMSLQNKSYLNTCWGSNVFSWTHNCCKLSLLVSRGGTSGLSLTGLRTLLYMGQKDHPHTEPAYQR